MKGVPAPVRDSQIALYNGIVDNLKIINDNLDELIQLFKDKK